MSLSAETIFGLNEEEIKVCLGFINQVGNKINRNSSQPNQVNFNLLGVGATTRVVELIKTTVQTDWEFDIKFCEPGIVVVHLLKRQVSEQAA